LPLKSIESDFAVDSSGLRSKTDVAMVNETLCKVLCHNLVVLIHEMHELVIETTFWPEKAVAQETMLRA
jgi:hypothetical protein